MRFDPATADPTGAELLSELSKHLIGGPLDETVRLLVEIRVSQINGCAFCLALHLRQARRRQISGAKIDAVAAWRDSEAFAQNERVALEIAEAMSRVSDGGRVDDSTWESARERFRDDELACLLYAIGLINLYNRMNVAVEMSDDLAPFLQRRRLPAR